MDKSLNTFWMFIVAGIGMQQNELLQFYLSIENISGVVNLQGTDSRSEKCYKMLIYNIYLNFYVFYFNPINSQIVV